MATLFLRGNIWYVKYWDRLSGMNRHVTTKCKNTREGKVQANRKLREIETQLYLNRFDPVQGGFFKKRQKESIRISEAFILYKEKSEERGIRIAQKTLEAIENGLKKLYKATGDTYVHLIDKNTVNKALRNVFLEDNNKGNTPSVYTRALHGLFEFLVEEGHIRENPIYALPVITNKPRQIPLEDVKKMLDYLKEREEFYKKSDRGQSFRHMQYYIKFLLMSALRQGEANLLSWEDIDLKRRFIITVTNEKGGREDIYQPIIKELNDMLLEMGPKEKGKVFSRFSDKRSPRRIWRTMMEKLSMTYTMHQFRKTATTYLIAQGVPLTMVKIFVRHTSEITTKQSYLETTALPLQQLLDNSVHFDL